MVYEKQGISLEEAQDKGRVKIIKTNGEKYKFTNILFQDSLYYGQKLNSNRLIKIYVDDIESVHLYNEEKSKSRTGVLVASIFIILMLLTFTSILAGLTFSIGF